MKILKIFGIVAGIHVFALILIFANPGCSSTSKPTPAPSDTVARGDTPPSISVPLPAPSSSTASLSAAPSGFNPDAPATAAVASSSSSNSIRFNPTRPGTPAASTLVTAPVTDVTPATTYTVKSGDTLWDLQKKFHIPYAEIAAANNLKVGAALHSGQKLIIPSKTPTAATSAPSAANGKAGAAPAGAPATNGKEVVKHMVKPGETLGAIAQIYGVKQNDIAIANNITNPLKLPAGKELIIPGWKTAGGTETKAGATKSGPRADATKAPAPASKPVFNIIEPSASAPASGPAGGEVPVIRIEDSPTTPAPKGN